MRPFVGLLHLLCGPQTVVPVVPSDRQITNHPWDILLLVQRANCFLWDWIEDIPRIWKAQGEKFSFHKNVFEFDTKSWNTKGPASLFSTITILNVEEDIYDFIFLENIQTRVLLLRHRELLEVPKSGGELKLQEIHLKSSVKPMVMIGVCILFTINKFVMISRGRNTRVYCD